MHKILFVCIHNSARSQMAEAYLNKYGSENFVAESAGLEPGTLNENVVKVLLEDGIDISKNKAKSVFDLFKGDNKYDAVITVCDASAAERCPTFPGQVKRIEWSFKDPSVLIGNKEDVLNETRLIRDEIKSQVQQFIDEASKISYWI